MILHNEFKPFSKLVYDDDDENVSTYRILGSLEILAIKNGKVVGINKENKTENPVSKGCEGKKGIN